MATNVPLEENIIQPVWDNPRWGEGQRQAILRNAGRSLTSMAPTKPLLRHPPLTNNRPRLEAAVGIFNLTSIRSRLLDFLLIQVEPPQWVIINGRDNPHLGRPLLGIVPAISAVLPRADRGLDIFVSRSSRLLLRSVCVIS